MSKLTDYLKGKYGLGFWVFLISAWLILHYTCEYLSEQFGIDGLYFLPLFFILGWKASDLHVWTFTKLNNWLKK
jgi:hypothetical protein